MVKNSTRLTFNKGNGSEKGGQWMAGVLEKETKTEARRIGLTAWHKCLFAKRTLVDFSAKCPASTCRLWEVQFRGKWNNREIQEERGQPLKDLAQWINLNDSYFSPYFVQLVRHPIIISNNFQWKLCCKRGWWLQRGSRSSWWWCESSIPSVKKTIAKVHYMYKRMLQLFSPSHCSLLSEYVMNWKPWACTILKLFISLQRSVRSYQIFELSTDTYVIKPTCSASGLQNRIKNTESLLNNAKRKHHTIYHDTTDAMFYMSRQMPKRDRISRHEFKFQIYRLHAI